MVIEFIEVVRGEIANLVRIFSFGFSFLSEVSVISLRFGCRIHMSCSKSDCVADYPSPFFSCLRTLRSRSNFFSDGNILRIKGKFLMLMPICKVISVRLYTWKLGKRI